MTARSPRRRRATYFVAIAACLALWGQLFSLAHLLLVPHTQCAEHGETVHGEGAQLEVAALVADSDVSSARPTGEPTRDEHDHCEVVSDRRVTTAPRVALLLTVHAIPLHEPAIAVATPALRPLYRLAPKISPPVRAA